MSQPTYSGRPDPDDKLHQIVKADAPDKPSHILIAPNQIKIRLKDPPRDYLVPQWANTVTGKAGWDPARNCDGCFTSAKFQPNNNCYAYACAIATNTFPQPGRGSGNIRFDKKGDQVYINDFDTAFEFAKRDGLQDEGSSRSDLSAAKFRRGFANIPGHMVALLISKPEPGWDGDYHWVRCDENENYSSWSHKAGGGAVMNFDFAGNPISDPEKACWKMNQGPRGDSNQDLVIEYEFKRYMFVPHGNVTII